MSKARDLAYFNFPVFSGATLNLASNTLAGTIAQFNAAVSDADLATQADLTSLSGTVSSLSNTVTTNQTTEIVSVISTNTTAVSGTRYVLTASLTLTLPASPTAGKWVAFSNRSGTTTPVIARNGSNIMGLAEDMTLDSTEASGVLIYTDATRGWVFE